MITHVPIRAWSPVPNGDLQSGSGRMRHQIWRVVLIAVLLGFLLRSQGATNPPVILSQPKGGVGAAGSSFAFDVLSSGTSPFSYQWWKTPSSGPEAAVTGATNLVFTIPHLVASNAGQYRVVISNSFGSVTSALATLTVSDPFIRIQPQGATLDASTNGFALTVEARGTLPLDFQWYTNGVAVPNATNDSLLLSELTRAREASYSVVVSNTAGVVSSAAAQLTVRDPVLLSQPATKTANEGDPVLFSVAAVGSAPLGYQWLYQGVPIVAATNRTVVYTNNSVEQSTSSLALTNVTPADHGSYTVRVTNSAGTVTSATADLTVYSLAILRQPTNSNVFAGTNQTSFNSVVAAGTPPLTYQWYFQPSTVDQTNIIAGATSNLLVLTNVTGALRGSYWVEVSNSKGATNSARATLTVSDPAINKQPVGGAIATGDDFLFNIGAASDPLSYQWLFNGAALPGETNATLQITNVTPDQAGSYAVTVSNAFGLLTSAAAALTVDNLVILSQPQAGWRAAGDDFEFRISVRGSQPLTYQWYFEGAMLAGQTASNLVLNSLTVSNVGAYWVTVTNATGIGVRSANATLMVFDPVILQQPTGGAPQPGTDFDLVVAAGGTPPFTYQWFFEGNPLGPAVQGGGPTNVFTLTNLNTTNSGAYWVQVTNTAGSLLSAQAIITVQDPFIIEQPQDADLDAGDNFTNSVDAVGTLPLSYQWFWNGSTLPGATNSTLIVTNLMATQGGTYFVEVSNAVGAQRSHNATLTVQDPAIREQPRGASAAVGEDYTFGVTATGTQPMTYQWFFNGALMTGKVGETLALSDLIYSQAGQYSVEVRNAAGSRMSSNAVLSISSSAPRVVSIPFFTTSAGSAECRPFFEGNGTENRVGFSVSYATNVLVNPMYSPATNEPVASATVITTNSLAGGSIGITIQLPAGITFPPGVPQWLGTLTFDVTPGSNAYDGGLDFPNVPVDIAAADLQGGSLALRTSRVPTFDFLDDEPQFNPQSGLFVQRFRLSNPTAFESSNAVVTVGGLGVDSLSNPVTFFNAHTGDYLADPDGNGVADTITRAAQVNLARGEVLPVTLEFYVSDRTTIPDYESYGGYFGSLGLQAPSSGTAISVRSARYVGGEFLVEFLTQSGSTYYVQYADSLEALSDPTLFKTAFPPVTGTGSYVQWIDNGAPKTASAPGIGMRFYKVIRSP